MKNKFIAAEELEKSKWKDTVYCLWRYKELYPQIFEYGKKLILENDKVRQEAYEEYVNLIYETDDVKNFLSPLYRRDRNRCRTRWLEEHNSNSQLFKSLCDLLQNKKYWANIQPKLDFNAMKWFDPLTKTMQDIDPKKLMKQVVGEIGMRKVDASGPVNFIPSNVGYEFKFSENSDEYIKTGSVLEKM